MRKVALLLIMLSMLVATVLPVSAQGPDEPAPSIAGIVASVANDTEDPEFTILLQAVENAGLVQILDQRGPFTVFAPTDEAFLEFFEDSGIDPQELLSDRELLTTVLLYHVLPGALDARTLSQIDDTPLLTVAPGAAVEFDVKFEGAFVDDALVIDADIRARNGVIHVIDSVLIPDDDEFNPLRAPEGLNSIGEFVATLGTDEDSPEFLVLLNAARTAGVVDTLLDENQGYTVFAPTDAAFFELLAQLGLTPDELLEDVGTVRAILSYHVLPVPVFAEDFVAVERGVVGTVLDGSLLFVNVNEAGVFINRSQVIVPNIEANNGVIHVIDSVLVPPRVAAELRSNRGMDGERGERDGNR